MIKPVVFSAALLLCLLPCPAQTAPAQPPPTASAPGAAYKGESLVFDKLSTVATFHADGTGEKLITVSVRIQTEDAVRNSGIVSIAYQSENERVEMLYLHVRKPDGSIVDTPIADAQDLPMPVTRAAPMYSDYRDREWPVRSLAVGDQLEYQVRIPLFKPMASGQFWGQFQFERAAVVLDQQLELHVPRDRHVQVVSPEDKFDRSETAGEVIYRWKTAHLEPTVATGVEPLPKPKPAKTSSLLPAVRWTSFTNWAEVGDWYRGLQASRAAVTPAIQAKADELTEGATSDDEKLHRLYTYVAAHIRYVGVDFGSGRYQPHAAAEVLTNQYGDCKDKHTLLQALLAAKGFQASPVLIGAGIHFDSDLPSPQSFNHLITLVSAPAKTKIAAAPTWLDSTAEVAPYGMLSLLIRDKDALVIPVDQAPAHIEKTPALAPFPAFERYEATATLEPTGALKADVRLTVRGDTELVLRSILRQVPQSSYPDFATGYASGIGLPGKATALKIDTLEHFEEPFTIAVHDEVLAPDEAPSAGQRTVTRLLLPKLFQTPTYDEQPLEPILLGNPRVISERSSITLPDTFTITLPAEVHLTSSFATYDSHCSLAGHSVICEATAEIKQPKLPETQWEEYNGFVKKMTADQLGDLTLVARGEPHAPASAIAEVRKETGLDDMEAAKLVKQAFDTIGRHDLETAAGELSQAEKLNGEQARLWSTYGYLAFQKKQYEEAVADYRKELLLYPDAFGVYTSLTEAELLLKQRSEAILSLQAAHKSRPEDQPTIVWLASLLTFEKRYPEALTLLQTAAFKNPGNKKLLLQLGNTQLAAGRTEEAVATLHTALEDATDPLVLNDAAYQLASHHADLPLAEGSARKALELLEAETQKFTLADVTQAELGRSSLLSATWDTLGWIDFLQNKAEAAETLIAAAWATSEHAEVGYHLGCVYEKLGKPKEALRAFHQARAAMRAEQTFAGSDELPNHIAALEKVSARGIIAPDSNAAGQERVYTLPLLTKKQAGGDYYLLLSPGKVESASWVEGAPELKEIEAKLASTLQPALTAPGKPALFPAGSTAKQVRRGVLSCSTLLHKCMLVLMLPQDARAELKAPATPQSPTTRLVASNTTYIEKLQGLFWR